MSLKQLLRGTGVAIVTPFDEQEKIDIPALERLIEFIVANRVDYVVVLGTTGETPVLSFEEKTMLIEETYRIVNHRVPVVVGVGGNHTAEVLQALQKLPLKQATAVLSASPYYNKPSQEGIFQHYKMIAAASPVPLILYNVPGRTGRNMTAATTIRLAKEVPNVAGIKEASGDMQQCMEILRDKPEDFLVVSGDDALALAQLACGMDGVISVAANCFPDRFSDMVSACLRQDFVTAKKINDPLIAVYELLFNENNPAGAKAFLFEMNILQNVLRLPLVPLSAEQHQAVRDYLSL